MSYSSNSSIPNGVGTSQSGGYVIQPQAIQSAITAHQHNYTQIGTLPRDDELVVLGAQWEAAYAAHVNGEMSSAQYEVVQGHLIDAMNDHSRRFTDYLDRRRAGQTGQTDWHKEFYGCTDEQANKRIQDRSRLLEMQRANREHNQSRMLHHSRQGRGQ